MNNKQMRRLYLIGMVVLLVSVLTAGAVSAQSGTSTSVTINETEFKLDPAQVTVPVNTPVQFTVKNAGTVEHNFKVELPSAGIEQILFAQNLKPGETQTASFTFSQAGSWEMYCPVDDHEGAGMKGTIMVVAAQAASQGGTPGTLPVTGAAGDLTPWGLAVLGLAALGLGLRWTRQAGRAQGR